MTDDQQRWLEYYQAIAGRKPRPLFVDALNRFGDFTGTAIDLGCGSGIETVELLRDGWQVTAIDNNPDAIALLRERVPQPYRPHLQTQVSSFEEATFTKADFIWAGLSLPFCAPEHFERVWQNILASLKVGGRFAGDLFGPRCTWATNPAMTFYDAARVREMLEGLELEHFYEEEGEGPTATQGTIYKHSFAVIARKPLVY